MLKKICTFFIIGMLHLQVFCQFNFLDDMLKKSQLDVIKIGTKILSESDIIFWEFEKNMSFKHAVSFSQSLTLYQNNLYRFLTRMDSYQEDKFTLFLNISANYKYYFSKAYQTKGGFYFNAECSFLIFLASGQFESQQRLQNPQLLSIYALFGKEWRFKKGVGVNVYVGGMVENFNLATNPTSEYQDMVFVRTPIKLGASFYFFESRY